MHRWVDGSKDGWMSGWTDKWVGKYMDLLMYGWMHVQCMNKLEPCINGWINDYVDECID